MNVPLYRDREGLLCAEHLWFKDLALHLSYLESFSLACPVIDGTPKEITVPLNSDPRFSRVQIIELPATLSRFLGILELPRTALRLWNAIKNAQMVHSGVAGWPIPYGWIVMPMAKLLRRKLIIIVESAPWRLKTGLPQNIKSRINAAVYERLAGWCVSRADLPIFTQEEYRRSLLIREPQKGHVIHASWIDSEVIISDSRAEAIWLEKIDPGSSGLSILFVGRLEAQKGVTVLLDAMRQLASKNVRVTLNVLGAGDLASECAKLAAQLHESTRVNVIGTVPYGPPLFQLLQRHHAVILPSISDEQPRIVYDAYSQGLPALASSTAGLRDCIHEDRTGWLVEPNSADKLAALIERAAGNIEELRRMGLEALLFARSTTHQRMHSERHRLLLEMDHPTAV